MPGSQRSSRHRAFVIGALGAVIAIGAVWWIVATAAGSNEPELDEAGAPISVLHADATMGAVEIRADDLAIMRQFYEAGVGLELIEESDVAVVLGSDGEELIRLVRGDGAPAGPRDAGLYHSAILFPDAPALAQALLRVATVAPNSYQGAADHLVSLAFYFGDPEGNGVELYLDTPSEEWVWEDGHVQMGSYPLDPNEFIAANLDEPTVGGATMGHVHLKVGNVDVAREFYSGVLGFAVTSESQGAVFMSVGGYHHHLAANSWQSQGAGARPASLGLASLAVLVPDLDELDALAERLDSAGLAYDRGTDRIVVSDPWENRVEIAVRP